MPVPTLPPGTSLDNACTVIHDNTLYSFSSSGLLSIRLEDGADWKTLDAGVKVTGATCVGTTPPDASQAGLFVVGGKPEAGADAFTGLQKFTFATSKWETITPTNLVTKNRQNHGSIYIKSLDLIMVYAGSQDGLTGPSSQTFTIKASAPFDVVKYDAAPATVSPTLLDWDGTNVALISGDPKPVMWWFDTVGHWRKSPASFGAPFAPGASMIVDGQDKSKSLYTFDLSQSPNKVTRMVLQDSTGSIVPNPTPVVSKNAGSGKRALTLDSWPDYNSTLAPTTTRQNYAFSYDADGMVVLSGGSKDPLIVFDATKNSWLNASAIFAPETQKVQDVSSTSSLPSSTAVSTSSITQATPTSTTGAALPPASAHHKDGLSSNAILGVTLGTIAGFLVLIGLILVLLRRRKNRQNHTEAGHLRRASGDSAMEKETLGIVSNAFPPASPGHFRGHNAQLSTESYSSMAILMGRMNTEKSGLGRKPSHDSHRSSVSSLHKQFKSTISKPIPQMNEHPALQGQDDRGVAFAPTVAEPRQRNGPINGNDGTRRSSGWNKYWSGGSALQILGFGNSKRDTVGSEQSSRYSQATTNNNNNSNNPRVTQDSATVPPLNFESRPAVNSVNSGSPVVAQHTSKLPMTEGMAGTIERPISTVSAVSALSAGYSSGIPESVNELWDPAEATKPWGANRAPSSAYTSNGHYETGHAANSYGGASGADRQPQLAMASTSDMSWLNLGDQSRDRS